MKPHFQSHSTRAARVGAGAAWRDSGVVLGLVVVDANRPTAMVGVAAGLLAQSIAPH